MQCPEECDYMNCDYTCNVTEGESFKYNDITKSYDFKSK